MIFFTLSHPDVLCPRPVTPLSTLIQPRLVPFGPKPSCPNPFHPSRPWVHLRTPSTIHATHTIKFPHFHFVHTILSSAVENNILFLGRNLIRYYTAMRFLIAIIWKALVRGVCQFCWWWCCCSAAVLCGYYCVVLFGTFYFISIEFTLNSWKLVTIDVCIKMKANGAITDTGCDECLKHREFEV